MALTQSHEGLKETSLYDDYFVRGQQKGSPRVGYAALTLIRLKTFGQIMSKNLRRLFHGYFFRPLK